VFFERIRLLSGAIAPCAFVVAGSTASILSHSRGTSCVATERNCNHEVWVPCFYNRSMVCHIHEKEAFANSRTLSLR
jgi:hypothetical protein